MASIKTRLNFLLVGILIGVVIGLPVGMNIGKKKPIFSNPFEERSLGDRAGDVLQDTKKALQKSLQD